MEKKRLKKLVANDANQLIDSVLTSENMRSIVGGASGSCSCHTCANLSCNLNGSSCPPVYA